MKLRRCVLLSAALYGALVAAGAWGARAAAAAKEPCETNVRIERIEREPVETAQPGDPVETARPAGPFETARPEETAAARGDEPAEARREEPAEARPAGPTEAARPEAVSILPLAVPTPLAALRGDDVFRKAYSDVYRILSGENQCSRFYGGPARAALVFNKFAATLKSVRLDSTRTGGNMSGGYYNVTHAPTGQTYRLFERAVINTDGPFYLRQISSGAGRVTGVGRFAPATREARALILLHELGHLMRGDDGNWLLRDDGRDDALSERNTAIVEEKCGGEIRALVARPATRATDEAAARGARTR
jgi:hypothetical protein